MDPAIKTVKIEKWVPGRAPWGANTPRVQPNAFPTKTAEIKIDQSTTPSVIDGAPLIIEFDKVFDRPANQST
jgi:hypothetical protein